MSKEKQEKKETKKEPEAKSVKKSSYSKKKKAKKNITNGKAFVLSTFNNTIISIADTSGNVVSWSSAGQKGFKGSRKSTPYAAQIAADDAGAKAYEQGLRALNENDVLYCGNGHKSMAAASFLKNKGINVKDIIGGLSAMLVDAPELEI